MKPTLLVRGLILNVLLFGMVQAEEIGLFFDPEGLSCCYGDSIAYPHFGFSYLILKSDNLEFSVNGWECSIRFDENIIVTSFAIAGNSINIGTNDNYIVGLGSPIIGSNGIVLLSSLTFVATGPGNCFLGVADPPSMPSWQYPIFLNEAYQPVEMTTEYGGLGQPSWSLGAVTCPLRNSSAGEIVGVAKPSSWGSLKASFE